MLACLEIAVRVEKWEKQSQESCMRLQGQRAGMPLLFFPARHSCSYGWLFESSDITRLQREFEQKAHKEPRMTAATFNSKIELKYHQRS